MSIVHIRSIKYGDEPNSAILLRNFSSFSSLADRIGIGQSRDVFLSLYKRDFSQNKIQCTFGTRGRFHTEFRGDQNFTEFHENMERAMIMISSYGVEFST